MTRSLMGSCSGFFRIVCRWGGREMKASRFGRVSLMLAALLGIASPGAAQQPGVENGEWRYLGGDAGHTRSSPLNQINAANFAKLKVAWIFRGDNFGPGLE